MTLQTTARSRTRTTTVDDTITQANVTVARNMTLDPERRAENHSDRRRGKKARQPGHALSARVERVVPHRPVIDAAAAAT